MSIKVSPGRISKKSIDILLQFVRSFYYRYIYLSWIQFGSKIIFQGKVNCLGVSGQISVGSNCILGEGIYLSVSQGGRIEIGESCSINHGGLISSLSSVKIGSRVRIGEYASIRDNDHLISGLSPIFGSGYRSIPIVIEDDVWIGRNVTIMPGITIGTGAIIGANSFVSKSIPAYSIAYGSPAQVHRTRSEIS